MKDEHVIRTMENILQMMPLLVISFLLLFGSRALLHHLNRPKKVIKPKKYKKKLMLDDKKLNLEFEQSETEVIQ